MPPALPLLAEALAFLDACRIEVALHPEDGRWHLLVRGVKATTGELVARAISLGMLGAARMQ